MNAPSRVASRPLVLIAVAHLVMRRLIFDLLDRDHGCWNACLLEGALETAVIGLDPDLMVIDGAGPVGWRREHLAGYPGVQIVVIGSEPDLAYRAAALRHGAGGWVASDDIADQLPAALRSAARLQWPSPTPAGATP